jgi:thioredoxin reductase (NADPH)
MAAKSSRSPLQPGSSAPQDEQAFPFLDKGQLKILEKFGRFVLIPKGDSVWEAATSDVCMFVVAKGAISVRDGRTGVEVARHRAGQFSGDIDVINGRPSIVSGTAASDLKVLIVEGNCVRAIVNDHPEVGEIILRAYLRRRKIMQSRDDVGVEIIGSRFSSDTLRIREFLTRSRYPQTFVDLENQADVHQFLKEFDVEESETPILILPNGKLLRAPSDLQIAHELGITPEIDSTVYDLVVVGGGPAGLAAAVYGASEGLSTLILDRYAPGGQAGTSSRIENYMGFPLGVSGQDLTDGAVSQAEKFGAKMVIPACAEGLRCEENGVHVVSVDRIGEITARCIILAPGANYKKLDLRNLKEFENNGVYYSATFVEQGYCLDEISVVVGGGNSAGQAAVFMSQKAARVILVVRANNLRKDMSSYLARRIESSEKIEVRLNSEVAALAGETRLRLVTLRNKIDGAEQTIEATGVFVMIGANPNTSWIPDQVAKDSKGFILTGRDLTGASAWNQSREPFFLETSCPGIFAVGDARSGSVKRVASAVGEGSMAVALIHKFLSL